MKLPDWLHSIHHDGSEKYVSQLNPRLGDTVRLRLRVAVDAPIIQVYLRTFPDGEQSFTPLTAVAATPPCNWWEVEMRISQPRFHYRFLLEAEDGMWAYSAAGPTAHIPNDNTDFQILADYERPSWLETAVFYQIFPDRFANGDPTTNPQPEEFSYKGSGPKTYPWETAPEPDQPFPLVYYGGDLPGIEQRLTYLQELGVNALYLNPIFSAPSNHKYDVTDYRHVDAHFGGDKALAALRQALTKREMRYILDIVPNHCGYWHKWFQAARQDEDAPEAEFFTFHEHPDKYESWLDVWTLPKLNYQSRELRRRIYGQKDSIFLQWLQAPYSADGWRVDVANMLGRQGATQIGDEVTREIHNAVKKSHPSAYLMGENFFDATPQLQGDQWDGVMNYTGLTLPLWYWLSGYREWAHSLGHHIQSLRAWSTEAMTQTWQSRRATVPWVIALQQYNLVDSHDTARIRSIVDGNKALHRLAAIVQFTFPGIPGIYYGDEIGMFDDPHLAGRGCMIWDESRWDRETLNFYKQLIAYRKESSTLQRGGFQLLSVEENSFCYQREGRDGRILVIAHRAAEPRRQRPLPVAHGGIADGTRFEEIFSGQSLSVTAGVLPIPNHPQGATLWQEI